MKSRGRKEERSVGFVVAVIVVVFVVVVVKVA